MVTGRLQDHPLTSRLEHGSPRDRLVPSASRWSGLPEEAAACICADLRPRTGSQYRVTWYGNGARVERVAALFAAAEACLRWGHARPAPTARARGPVGSIFGLATQGDFRCLDGGDRLDCTARNKGQRPTVVRSPQASAETRRAMSSPRVSLHAAWQLESVWRFRWRRDTSFRTLHQSAPPTNKDGV